METKLEATQEWINTTDCACRKKIDQRGNNYKGKVPGLKRKWKVRRQFRIIIAIAESPKKEIQKLQFKEYWNKFFRKQLKITSWNGPHWGIFQFFWFFVCFCFVFLLKKKKKKTSVLPGKMTKSYIKERQSEYYQTFWQQCFVPEENGAIYLW